LSRSPSCWPSAGSPRARPQAPRSSQQSSRSPPAASPLLLNEHGFRALCPKGDLPEHHGWAVYRVSARACRPRSMPEMRRSAARDFDHCSNHQRTRVIRVPPLWAQDERSSAGACFTRAVRSF
jgi:hypothetical protein